MAVVHIAPRNNIHCHCDTRITVLAFSCNFNSGTVKGELVFVRVEEKQCVCGRDLGHNASLILRKNSDALANGSFNIVLHSPPG